MRKFFARDPEVRGQELREELYDRLARSQQLLASYSNSADLTPHERGYAQGVREETRYLEKLIDCIERS